MNFRIQAVLLVFLMLIMTLPGCGKKNISGSASPEENKISAKLLLKSGTKHLESRDLKSARRDLETAARLNPEDPGIFVALGDVYDELYMLKEAEAAFRTAIKLSPDNFDAHWAFGMILYQMNRYGQAENALKTAIGLNTSCGKAFYDLGHIYLRQGKVEEAEKAYLNSIRIEPNNPCTYTGMAEFLIHQKKYEKAAETLQKGLEVNSARIKNGEIKSEEGHLRSALANVYRETKKYDRAEKQIRLAIKADPTVVNSYYVMGELMKDMGKLDEAVLWLDKALKINPYDPSLLTTMADIEGKRNRLASSEEIYNKALALSPQDIVTQHSIHMGLGEIALLKKNYDKAAMELEAAVKIRPDYTPGLYSLARTYALMSNEEACCKNLTTLSNIDRGRIDAAVSDPAFKSYRKKDWFNELVRGKILEEPVKN